MKLILAVCFGEFLGTFILVFFGTAIVAVALLLQVPVGLVQLALVWGSGVALAIYATLHLSCAHLNPAVSLGIDMDAATSLGCRDAQLWSRFDLQQDDGFFQYPLGSKKET